MLGHALQIVPHVDVITFRNTFGDDRLGAWQAAKQALDLLRDILDARNLRALDFDANGRLNARALHHDAPTDRLYPGVHVSDGLRRPVHLYLGRQEKVRHGAD